MIVIALAIMVASCATPCPDTDYSYQDLNRALNRSVHADYYHTRYRTFKAEGCGCEEIRLRLSDEMARMDLKELK